MQVEQQARNAADPTTRTSVLEGVFTGFFEELRRRRRSPRTVRCYASDLSDLDRWFRERFGRPIRPADLEVGCASAYREHLRRVGRSVATIHRRMTTLRRCADWAHRQGWLSEESAATLRQLVSSGPPPSGRPDRALDEETVARLLAALDGPRRARDLAMVRVLLETGLKVGALVQLDLNAVDFRGGGLRVDDPLRPPRVMALSGSTLGALARYVKIRGLEPGPLFRGERGPLGANAVQRVLRHLGRALGLDLSPGVLRHTFARRLLSAGAQRLELADAMGHGCLESARIYRRRAEYTAGQVSLTA